MEAEPRGAFDKSEMFGENLRESIRNRGVPLLAQPLCERAGIDTDWAGYGAEPIGSTGIQRHVGEIGFQRRGCVAAPRHLAAYHDSLPRRQREIAAGAARFAEAAFDALVDFLLHAGQALQIGQMRARVRVDENAGVEQVLRVGQFLYALHDAISFRPPFSFDKRRHVAAGAVFAFERSVVAVHHQTHHVIHEPRILIDGLLVGERWRDYEMKIAVFGVAEDDGIVVAVLCEDALQVDHGIGEPMHRKNDILNDDTGATAAHGTDGWKHARPDLPQCGLLRWVMSESRRFEKLQFACGLLRALLQRCTVCFLGTLEFHEQAGRVSGK